MERNVLPATILLACAALAAGPACAQEVETKPPVRQEGGAVPRPAANSPKLLPVGDLLTAPVVLGDAENHAARGATESTEKELQEIEEGTTGAKAKAPAASAVTVVGTLRDIAMDTQTRQLTVAIVDTKEGGRAVPLTQLTWDDANRQWRLPSRDAWAKAQSCDGLSLARLHGGIADARANKGSDSKASGIVVDDGGGTARRDPLDARYDLVSIFGRRELMARDGRAGAGLGVVIDVRSGTLGFFRVATERGDLAVPFAALQVPADSGVSGSYRVNVDMDKAALSQAPLLGKDPKWSLDDAQFRTQLYEFFGVPTPAYEGTSGAPEIVARRK